MSAVRQALDAWTDAIVRGDRDAAAAILDDEYELTSAGGVGNVARSAWLESLGRIDTRSLDPLELREVVLGDVAVVAGRWRWDASIEGRDLTGDYAITDVLVLQDGAWRPRWRISTKVDV